MTAPPEPSVLIVKVSDRDDDEWLRGVGNRWAQGGAGAGYAWADLVEVYGPISAELPDPIVLTDEMLMTGWGRGYDLEILRGNVAETLRAGGYEVSE